MSWRDAAGGTAVMLAAAPLYAAAAQDPSTAPEAAHADAPALAAAPAHVATAPASGTDATQAPPARGFRLANALGGDAAGFRVADTIVPFHFPADHGAHPNFRTEWWYLTAALAAATGEEYGVQFTLFRQGLVPGAGTDGWRATQIYMGHLALTDVARARHLEAQRLARGHPRLAGVRSAPFSLWIDGWRLASTSAAFYPLRLDARDREFGFDLTLASGSAPVPQGDDGLSAKGPNNASHYYSMPRIAIAGEVFQGTRTIPVSGLGWLDREWSSGVLSAEHIGWNWFALQLDDGLDLMVFTLRRRDGAIDTYNQGLLIDADGRRALHAQDFTLTALKWWRDSAGVRWPVRWRLTFAAPLAYRPQATTAAGRATPPVPSKRVRSLTIEAAIDDQVMDTLVRYWEGLVRVRGGDGGDLGRGYMELTGYE